MVFQPLYKRVEASVGNRLARLQQIEDLHVCQRQQAFQRNKLVRLKCIAVRGPKATQPEIEFEQAAAAAPADRIRHGV